MRGFVLARSRLDKSEFFMDMRIGLLVFPNITQLDLTGPYEVFTKFPGSRVDLVWKNLEPLRAGGGLTLVPSATYESVGQLDILCVPGGAGMNSLLNDVETLEFLREQAKHAQYVTSVCTGALVLGAAGLLRGKRATTHWMSHDLLAPFGAIPMAERVVVDGNVITGGGVTAGIDFALRVAAEVLGEDAARGIQLGIEYDPQPPFDAGHPRTAAPELVERVRGAATARQQERADAVATAVSRLL